MYRALYREYRPEVFSEMLGQEHIVRILTNQIRTGSTSHAYLFCGTRGTGKTTAARLLAKGLNCTAEGDRPCGVCDSCRAIRDGNFLDVIEIDAASNNGVDNIRELRESVKYPPAAGRQKVYIVDEVHMLSTGAFNALLKTLEEPPEYVTFILATTEPEKLPATILSRCMRLDFKRVPEASLIRGMSEICRAKGLKVSEDALRIIAANADGSVRDGLSILDQCIAGGQTDIEAEDVLDLLGASGEETFLQLTELVRKGRTADAIAYLAQALEDGKDVKQFMKDWIDHFRNLLLIKFLPDPQEVLHMSAENIERIRRQSEVLEVSQINLALMELSRIYNEARRSTQPRILLELAIVQLSAGEESRTANPVPRTGIVTEGVLEARQVQTKKAKVPAEPAQPAEAEHSTAEAPAEQEPAAAEEAGQTLQESTFDKEAVWKAVFDDVEAAKGSFYVLATDGHLEEIREHDFILRVDRGFQKQLAEKNRALIERLVARHTDGTKRHMQIRTGEDPEAGVQSQTEDTARKAGELLGIEVEISG